MPRVSVIVPVYNVERWLPACLDSVLAQTLRDIEVICVDDASPDGCSGILADYAERDARVHVITLERNSGQGIARNVGFEASTGRYVYFLDSDDMVEPNALEELAARADADELDGIFFDSSVVFDTPQLQRRHRSYPAAHTGSYPAGVMKGSELFEAFIGQRDWTCYVQRQLWRSDFLRREGVSFPTWYSHEDEAFAFEALLAAERVAFVPEPYFVRRYREGSVMTSAQGLRNFASYFQGHSIMSRFAHDRGMASEAIDRNIARIYNALVRIHASLVADGVDVLARFEDTELLGEYLLFASAQKAPLLWGSLSETVLERLRAAKRVYVYGAGILGGDVFEVLSREMVPIEGFLVTSAQGNPAAFRGHRVFAIDSVPVDSGALVLIALTDGYRAEVERELDSRGWKHVYCKDGMGI